MGKYCQNPFCENEASKKVPVSVDRSSDQRRSLCAVCEEAYSWGVQHGRMSSMRRKVWVLHVTDGGEVVHARVFRNRRKAVKDLAGYLRAQEGYSGPEDLPDISDWLAQHKEHLNVDLFPAPIDWS
jgi:hypothetical protein